MTTTHLTDLAVQRASRRLDRAEVAATWGRTDRGLLAICGPDEDALTLAVQAAGNLPLGDVDVVVFASPTSPRPGGSVAATAAVALGLGEDVRTIDLGGSRRCATEAFAVARDLLLAEPARRVLVLVGDDRRVADDHADEAAVGHAGVAAVVSTDPGAAELVAIGSASDAGPDRWTDTAGAMRTAGERFLAQAVFPPALDRAVSSTTLATHLEGITGVHVAAATPKQAASLAGRIARDADTAAADLWTLGDAGAAMPGLLLAAALRDAEAGERHAVVALGSGADVLVVTAGAEASSHVIVDEGRATRLPYGLYLRHRGRMVVGPAFPDASPVVAWRDQEAVVGLVGATCEACDARAYPPRSSCPTCQAPGPGRPVRMAGPGHVATFTTDHLVAGVNPGTPESPTTMAVVDLDAGGRVFLPTVHGMAPTVGQRVTTVFRVAHDGGGFRHHHWRVAPLDREEMA